MARRDDAKFVDRMNTIIGAFPEVCGPDGSWTGRLPTLLGELNQLTGISDKLIERCLKSLVSLHVIGREEVPEKRKYAHIEPMRHQTCYRLLICDAVVVRTPSGLFGLAEQGN